MIVFPVKSDNLNFISCFRVLNTVLKIFGLSALKCTTKNGNINYEISYLGITHSFLISLLTIYVFYIQIVSFKSSGNNFVLSVLHCYVVTSGTLMTVLMIATGAYNSLTFAKLLNNKLYSSVFQLQLRYKEISLVSLKQLLLSFSFLLVAFASDFFSADKAPTLSLAINLLIYFLFPVYNSLCIIQFYVTIFWLKCVQVGLNQDLTKLLRRKNDFAMNGDRVVGKRTKEESLSEDIRRLRGLSHKVFNVWKRIDSVFSTRNIFLLFHHCALGTLYAYWALRKTLSKKRVSYPFLLNLYRAALMSCASVIRIVWPCNAAILEAKKTIVIVNEILTCRDLFSEEVEELNIFSVQLLEERAVFAPYEFFDLSNKILLRMLATVTSYLIILLQYNSTDGETFRVESNATYSY